MTRAGLVICVFPMLMSVSSPAQQAAPEGSVRVILPRDVDTDSCRFEYLIGGSFGGFGSLSRPKRDLPGFEIEMVHNGAAVNTVTAFLACSGYQVVPIAFNSATEVEHRTLRVALKRLPTAHFAGVVRGWAASETQRYVEIRYWPLWRCRYFRLADCLLGYWTLARVPIEQDGTFAADLPDFLRDDTIGRFSMPDGPGEVEFNIRDPRTGNVLFELKPAGSGLPLNRLPVRSSYPQEQMFDLEPPR
jgi:hypothetical protein